MWGQAIVHSGPGSLHESPVLRLLWLIARARLKFFLLGFACRFELTFFPCLIPPCDFTAMFFCTDIAVSDLPFATHPPDKIKGKEDGVNGGINRGRDDAEYRHLQLRDADCNIACT